MEEKVRVGIVGASGWMAGALAVAAEYDEEGFDLDSGRGQRNSLSRVTALCDLDQVSMESRIHTLDLQGARTYPSYDKLLESDQVDALVIAVPNHLHAPFAVRALEAGKHLFLEKPLATRPGDSERLLRVAADSPLTTKLDYILVHYDEQENLRKLVEGGAFGELASVFFTYRHPIQVSQSVEQSWKLSREISGGAIPMGVCHAISMALYQVDSAPVTVLCRTSRARIRPFDYDTQVDLMIVFEDGVVCVVQGNIDFAEKYDARHTLIGTGGQFDYNPFAPLESRVSWSSRSLGRDYEADPGFARQHLDSGDVWKHQCYRTMREFIGHVLRGEKDSLLGLEAPLVKRVEAVIWAAEESASKQGRPVQVTVV